MQVSKYGHRAHVHGKLITLPYLYNNYICAKASILVSAVQSKSVLGSAAADQLDFRLGRAVKMSCKCNLQGFSCWQCQVTQSWPLSETQMKASLGRDGRDKVKSS